MGRLAALLLASCACTHAFGAAWNVAVRRSASRWTGLRASVASVDTVLSSKVAELSEEDRRLAQTLLDLEQHHIFEPWAEAGQDEARKQAFFRQVAELEANYPGGLRAYVTKARDLLEQSAEGVNPFEGFTPTVPEGAILDFGTREFDDMERLGLQAAAEGVGFVLVAGGLGERLGYSGIKIELPVELLTGRSFIKYYVETILALERHLKLQGHGVSLPLTIMTSGDTDGPTRALLRENANFGMADENLRIVKQEKVAALSDRRASLAMSEDDPYVIETKPHGHGDVHHLMLKEKVLDQWAERSIKWLFFLQDTNLLVINSILPALGVSKARDLDMNSICIPRTAGEAAGAITRLVKEGTGEELTINVEYNQLDPLLRATISPELGDTNDPELGCSPFPGNANNLVFKFSTYKKVCEGEAQGVVPEFVNPKYADAERNLFKKPTRLECMMQDFPRLIQAEMPQDGSNIGFVSFPKWLSFSPAKNSLDAGAANAKNGNPPGTVASAEADFYAAKAKKLESFGMVKFTGDPLSVEIEGVAMTLGPLIAISPDNSITTDLLRAPFTGEGLTMDRSSALQIEGAGSVIFDGVTLNGDLTIHIVEGATLRLVKTQIATPKPVLKKVEDGAPFLTIRGFDLVRAAASDRIILTISEPGEWIAEETLDSLRR